MTESFLDLVFEIIEAGFSLGFCNKEGALTVEYGEEDGFHYYVAGDGIKTLRHRTHDRAEFRRVVNDNGVWDVNEDIRSYFACVGYRLLESGEVAQATQLFDRAVANRYPIGHVGLAIAASRDGDQDLAKAELAEALDAETARWYGRSGILESFAEGPVRGIWDDVRHERLCELWGEIIAIDVNQPRALFGRALAREELKAWLDASGDYAMALKGRLPQSKRERARFGLVRCLVCGDRIRQAREALAAAPDDGLTQRSIDRLEKMLWNPKLALRW